MEQTRIFRALRGSNGQPAADLSALEEVLVRFSQLVAEQRLIREIDINPLFVSDDTVLALDARIILHDASVPASRLPALAIRPYPETYTSPFTLADGTPVSIRPIRPEDEPLMVAFHQTLSDRTVYHRFLGARSLEERTEHGRLARLCFIDYDREIALVAVREDPELHRPEIIGVARLCRVHGKNEAEFAVVVSDRWQRRRLGTQLLKQLIEIGRAEGIQRIFGVILAGNQEMRRVCERVGFKARWNADQTECQVEIGL
jgi:acetyltransferase